MAASINAQNIANDLKFEFSDSFKCPCWCPCFFSNKRPEIIYINQKGEIERYSPKKGKGSEDHIKSANRIENMIRLRLRAHTNEVEKYIKQLQDKGHIYFAIWKEGETQLTLNHIEEINRVLSEIAEELASIKG